MDSRKCSHCQVVKHIEQFDRCARNTGGRHYWCKDCKSEYARAYYEANKEKLNQATRDWIDKNREQHNAHVREYHRRKREAR